MDRIIRKPHQKCYIKPLIRKTKEFVRGSHLESDILFEKKKRGGVTKRKQLFHTNFSEFQMKTIIGDFIFYRHHQTLEQTDYLFSLNLQKNWFFFRVF